MDMPNIWKILADRGFFFRTSPTYKDCWEYTIPVLTEIWHGPYRTQEEAFMFAITHIMSLALSNHEPVYPEDPNLKLIKIKEQLRALQLMQAYQGISKSIDVEIKISKLLKMINDINED